jgi:FemAB-related protein (PEP-CTERM system-associated)
MNFEIRQLSGKDEKKWDEFVMTNNNTTFYHQIGWKKVVEETYKHKPYYLFAESETGEVVGILPIFLIKDMFFGKRLVSVPFAPYGGVCCETDEVENALINEAINIGKNLGVGYCEQRYLSDGMFINNYPKTKFYVTSILELEGAPENTLQKMTRNKRKTIYKSQRKNLKMIFSDERKENQLFYDFYEIYTKNMKRLGTPHHSDFFFRNILRYTNSDVACVYMNDKCCYGAIVLFFKDTLIDFMSSALIEYRNYYVTDFGIWNLILKAHESNCRYIDFGRSIKDSENWEFKRRWGAETIHLNYCYPLSEKLNPSKLQPSKYGKFAKMWSKLPGKVTKVIGPRVRRYIP